MEAAVYRCFACSNSLPPSSFSNSQINKLQHKKIESARCTKCTADAVVLVDGPSKKTKELKPEIQVNEAKRVVKQFDPSAQYIRNPRNTPIVKDAMAFASSKGLDYQVSLGPREGWRTVVKMAVRGVVKKNKRGKESIVTIIGLFKPGSHNVVPCTESKAHHPSINAALRTIEEARARIDLQGYIEGSGYEADDNDSAGKHPNCFLKYIILTLARESNRVQLAVVWNTEPNTHTAGETMLTKFLLALLGDSISEKSAEHAHTLFHSVWVNYNPSSRYNNAITGRGEDAWKLLYGERYVQEMVRTDMKCPPKLLFPPFVFRQANICAFTNIIVNVRYWIKDLIRQRGTGNVLLKTAMPHVVSQEQHKKRKFGEVGAGNQHHQQDKIPGVKCVELYAGVGTIGLNCLDLLAELNCSDENPHNLACFEAARLRMLPESCRQRASYRSEGATTVAQSGGLRGFDLVIVDPPRKGLDEEVLNALLQFDTRVVESTSTMASKAQKQQKQLTDGADRAAGTEEDLQGVRNNIRLIYVSCGFPAFKRDTARLIGPPGAKGKGGECGSGTGHGDGGAVRYWQLVHLEGHILFPGSDHIETLAVFDRIV